MARITARTLVHLSALAAAAGLTPTLLARQTGDPYAGYRNRTQVTLPGTLRNFLPADQGGHTDFRMFAETGVGRYVHVAAPIIGPGHVPAFSSTGSKLRANWLDRATRAIIPTKSYIGALPGDVAGSILSSDGGTVHSSSSFGQWFRTIDGVNTAQAFPITMRFDSSTQAYIFNGTLDGFPGGGAVDHTYTYGFDVPFVFERDENWYLTLATNGDAWVFIDDKLVIDNAGGMGARPAIVVQDSFLIDNSAAITVPEGTLSVSTNSTAPGAITVQNSAQISGDVMVGAGGDPATGISTTRPDAIGGATGSLGEPMPVNIVSPPTGMPASSGVMLIRNETRTLSGDLHVSSLTIRVNAIVRISGPTRILCDGNFDIEQGSSILLDPGARLELYCGGSITVRNSVWINVAPTSGDPDRLILSCLGTGNITLDQSAYVCAHLVAPRGTVTMSNTSSLIGSITARSAQMQNTASLTASGTFGTAFGGATMGGTQRIDFDRLAWLTENRTHRLRVFFANRLGQASRLRIESNCTLLNIAAIPGWGEHD